MSDASTVELVEQLRRANAGLREALAARDAENVELRAVVHALSLQVAELQRRLGSGSDDSGLPPSKESIEARARRTAERAARRQERGGSSRQRLADRSPGGQPGHPGRGLRRDPDPQQRQRVDPPQVCRGCGDSLAQASDAGTAWSQVWDVKVLRWRIEYLLPRRCCGCGVSTTAVPPVGGLVNGVSFGPVLNTAAVALTAFGNVPTERAAHLIEIMFGQAVSAGFVTGPTSGWRTG